MFNNSSSNAAGAGGMGGLLPNGNPFLNNITRVIPEDEPVNINTLEGNFGNMTLNQNDRTPT